MSPAAAEVTACPFTYDHYREILERLRAAGAAFIRFGEPLQERTVWLRHDVDLDPEATLPLAEVESALGATATYLFQVTSSLYNVLAPATAGVIRRLQELGHEVGLHLNLHAYTPGSSGPMDALARREAGVLALVTGVPVRVVSFHRPAPAVLGQEIPGLISTYAPPYFRASKYLSDSEMHWREGCACHQAGSHLRLQLLTHAEWWAAAAADRAARLAGFRQRHRQAWEAALAVEVAPPKEGNPCQS